MKHFAESETLLKTFEYSISDRKVYEIIFYKLIEALGVPLRVLLIFLATGNASLKRLREEINFL